MVTAITQSAAPVISVAVGSDIRVRENQKLGDAEKVRVPEKGNDDKGTVAPSAESRSQKAGQEQVEEVIARLQKTLQDVEPRIELSVDKELNQVIFRILDKESGELIRQIPPEEVLELDRFFADQSGLFVEEEI